MINFPFQLFKKTNNPKLYSGHYIFYFFDEFIIPKTKVIKQIGSFYPSGKTMLPDKTTTVRVQTAKKQIQKYLQEGWVDAETI